MAENRKGPHFDFGNDQLRAVIAEVLSPVFCMAMYRPPSLFDRKDVGGEKKIYYDEYGNPFPEATQKYFQQVEINQAILDECARFSEITYIDLDKDPNTQIVIGSSIAASPHTVLWAPYEIYENTYREVAQKYGLNVPQGPIVVTPDSTPENTKTPEVVPLDGLAWVFRRNKQTGHITPVDINDFASKKTGDPNIDKYKLNLDIPMMTKIFENFAKRIHIHAETNLRIFNEYTVKQFPFLPKKTIKDMLQGYLVGYFRGDYIKGLLQHYFSGEGMGPMSNPTLHGRSANHFGMDMANVINLLHHGHNLYQVISWLKDEVPPEVAPYVEQYVQLVLELEEEEKTPEEEVVEESPATPWRKDHFFRHDLQLIDLAATPVSDKTTGQILKEALFGDKPKVKIEELVKMIDPFGTIMHDELIDWMKENFIYYFYKNDTLDEGLTVTPFRHHTKETERELRASEGLSIQIDAKGKGYDERMAIVADALARVAKFNGEILMPFWDDVKEFVSRKYLMTRDERTDALNNLVLRHGLPEKVAPLIAQIVPTERQFMLAIQQERQQLQNRQSEHEQQYEKNKKQFNEIYRSEGIMRNAVLGFISNRNVEILEEMEKINDRQMVLANKEWKTKLKYMSYKVRLGEKIEAVKAKIASGNGTTEDLIDYATMYQQGQIFDDPKWNTGLNISGVPGLVITFNAEEGDNVVINVGTDFSTKGLLETWTGGMVRRQERK